MALFSVRSERQLCEQLGYNLLFRWFLDLDMSTAPFDHSTFSKNRERLMRHEVAALFFQQVVEQARSNHLVSSEHFSVDGTLIEAWASMKSFVPKETADAHRRERNRRKADRRKRKGGGGGKGSGGSGSNRDVNFHGTKRSNATHESSTDPDAALYRKGPGKEAKLYYAAHALMENRNGLLVGLSVSRAVGTTERDEALRLLKAAKRRKRATVGGDKGYDAAHFVDECRDLGITPHVAMNNNGRRSAIDERSRDHVGYWVSQRVRKRIEEVFGWAKTYGGLRKSRFVGRERTELAALLVGAAYNLMRISRLVTV
jgi:IS5 family transposase